MAPQRFRALQEDSRSESSSIRDKQPGVTSSAISKARRHQALGVAVGSNLKDVTAASGPQHDDSFNMAEKVQWTSFDVSVLNAYRQAHHLNTPAPFLSSYNQNVLTRPGVAASSPTMALHKNRRRASKENLAFVVRKDFNAAMTSEPETITSFLYTVQNHGKSFRTRFEPARAK